MARHKDLHVLFPLGGLNRKGAYRQQKPYTTPDAMNVRPSGVLEGRDRGGSRPGLIESHIDDIGSNPRLLFPMVLALGDNFTSYSDTFSGTEFSTEWTQAEWASGIPNILPDALASVDTDTAEGEVVRDALPIDATNPYTVEMFIVPWAGAFHGEYRLYLRLDDGTPAIATDGVEIVLTMTGTDGSYSCTMTSYKGGAGLGLLDTAEGTLGSAQPGWLSATVVGDDVTVYWNGVQLISETVDTPAAGLRVGFGLKCSVEGGLSLVNVFRVQYYSTSTVDGSRTMLIASAGGDLWREETHGRLTVVASDLTVRDDTLLTAAQSGQELHIADYGDLRVTGTDGTVAGADLDAAGVADWTVLGIDKDSDVVVVSNVGGATVAQTYEIDSVAVGALTLTEAPGNGTCSYRIERAPKVYDPSANTIVIHTASDGQVPTGCPLVCRYLDRIVLAGADIAPHVWYMSRQGDPNDWDYSQDDSQRAVAGTSSEAGMPGTAILALIPHSDDYLIMGCRNELWRLRGDPAYGGKLDALSHTIGIIGPRAWCLGPSGELIFLSLDGLYVLPPGGDSAPISLSREVLPQEFLNLNPNTLTALLEFDTHGRGVHIFLTPDASSVRTHWWFAWETKTYWPVSLAADHDPLATCVLYSTAIEDSSVILGCRDGILRRFSALAGTDCGTAYTTYVTIGPIPLAKDGMLGSLLSMEGVMAEGAGGTIALGDSGDVTWSLHPASTFEGAVNASESDSGTWGNGLNAKDYPACRGQAAMLKVTGSSGRKWAFEQCVLAVRESGRRRLS